MEDSINGNEALIDTVSQVPIEPRSSVIVTITTSTEPNMIGGPTTIATNRMDIDQVLRSPYRYLNDNAVYPTSDRPFL